MTRTAIAQNIAKKNNLLWKNLYSGVFRDLDEILIPLGIVVEAGRLPLKRGPKALQEKGVPYYQLTPEGLLVVLSIDDKSWTTVRKDTEITYFCDNCDFKSSTIFVMEEHIEKKHILDLKESVLNDFLSKAEIKEEFESVIRTLVKISPKFTYSMFEIYVRAYCEGKLENLLPFSISEFQKISKNVFVIQNELLTGFVTLSKSKRLDVLNFFSKFA